MTTIRTIGHGARTLESFLVLLERTDIRRIVDIRRFPGSRKHPHFGADALRDAMGAARIAYEHAPDLGGFRRPAPDSPNVALRNESFRAFADHMDTPEFREALDGLARSSAGLSTAIMCAESVWWRCHRRLVADALTVRGVEVEHVLDGPRLEPHRLTAEARRTSDGLRYDRSDGQQNLLDDAPKVTRDAGRTRPFRPSGRSR